MKEKIAAFNNANKKVIVDKKGNTTALNTWERFFTVFYYRKSAKRFKEQKDGFVITGSLFSILVSDEGKRLAKNPRKQKDIYVGDKYEFDLWSCELIEERKPEEYTSGTCFLNLQAAVNRTVKTQKKLNQVPDDQKVDPFAPQNGVDLTKVELESGDLLIYNN